MKGVVNHTFLVCRVGAGYRFGFGSAGDSGINVWCNTATFTHASGSLESEGWHYVECVIDCTQGTANNRAKLYVDRVLVSASDHFGTWSSTLSTSPTSFTIGVNDDYDNFYTGQVANVYVCNGIPTSGSRNVIGNYQRPITGKF